MRNLFEHINNELLTDFGSMRFLHQAMFTTSGKITVLELKGDFASTSVEGLTVHHTNLDDYAKIAMCPMSGAFYLVSKKGFVFRLVRKTFKQKLLTYFKNKS